MVVNKSALVGGFFILKKHGETNIKSFSRLHFKQVTFFTD
jgi:hypothetical protein